MVKSDPLPKAAFTLSLKIKLFAEASQVAEVIPDLEPNKSLSLVKVETPVTFNVAPIETPPPNVEIPAEKSVCCDVSIPTTLRLPRTSSASVGIVVPIPTCSPRTIKTSSSTCTPALKLKVFQSVSQSDSH